mmetsp:Transcript_11120/g.18657  ORF Transcript_11120/g.18657 Transcript_11120/m.18657 type:complete len:116 (-) Transcript_11120:594-941(-)
MSFSFEETPLQRGKCHVVKSPSYVYYNNQEETHQVFPFSNFEELVFLRHNPTFIRDSLLRILKLSQEVSMQKIRIERVFVINPVSNVERRERIERLAPKSLAQFTGHIEFFKAIN